MITTTGEYALRATVHLAQHYPQPQTTVLIAEATKVPIGYLSKVLQSLVRRDVVTSQRGLHGGFVLATHPAEITVFTVLDAVDAAPKRLTKCPLGLKGHISLCPVHKLVDDAVAHAQAAFSKATLADLVKSTGGSVPLCEAAS